MAKKSKNKNLPKWLKSKYFLLGTALVVAALAILGFRTFASGVYIPTPCLGGTIKQGSNNTCVYYAKKALNYSCATNQAITVSNYFNYDTYKRVYGFQWAAKIPQDGVIGPTTWNNLLHYNKEHPAHSLNCGYFTR